MIALVSGLFGASFFMLIQLQTTYRLGTYNSIRTLWSWPLIFLRCAVGIGGACILYFFYETELLGGTLWPDLHELRVEHVKVASGIRFPNKDLSLLIIWSFLAGYSQTLVQSVLDNTQRTYSSSDQPIG